MPQNRHVALRALAHPNIPILDIPILMNETSNPPPKLTAPIQPPTPLLGLSSDLPQETLCPCHLNAMRLERLRDVGTDRNYSDIDLQICPRCAQIWLRFAHVEEGFSGSGLWYLVPLTEEAADRVTIDNARACFEMAPEYWAGGSYFNSTGFKRSGRLIIAPYIGIM